MRSGAVCTLLQGLEDDLCDTLREMFSKLTISYNGSEKTDSCRWRVPMSLYSRHNGIKIGTGLLATCLLPSAGWSTLSPDNSVAGFPSQHPRRGSAHHLLLQKRGLLPRCHGPHQSHIKGPPHRRHRSHGSPVDGPAQFRKPSIGMQRSLSHPFRLPFPPNQ